MSHLDELARVASQLATCGETLIEAAKALNAAVAELKQEPTTKAETPTNGSPEPVPTVAYAFTDVRQAAADASRRGHRAEVKALLSKYNVEKLSDLGEEMYPAFMKDLEEIPHG